MNKFITLLMTVLFLYGIHSFYQRMAGSQEQENINSLTNKSGFSTVKKTDFVNLASANSKIMEIQTKLFNFIEVRPTADEYNDVIKKIDELSRDDYKSFLIQVIQSNTMATEKKFETLLALASSTTVQMEDNHELKKMLEETASKLLHGQKIDYREFENDRMTKEDFKHYFNDQQDQILQVVMAYKISTAIKKNNPNEAIDETVKTIEEYTHPQVRIQVKSFFDSEFPSHKKELEQRIGVEAFPLPKIKVEE